MLNIYANVINYCVPPLINRLLIVIACCCIFSSFPATCPGHPDMYVLLRQTTQHGGTGVQLPAGPVAGPRGQECSVPGVRVRTQRLSHIVSTTEFSLSQQSSSMVGTNNSYNFIISGSNSSIVFDQVHVDNLPVL